MSGESNLSLFQENPEGQPDSALVEPVARVLKQRTGLDPSSLGCKGWQRALNLGFQQSHCPDWATYLQRLHHSPPLFEQLVESLVVPETWFLRDRAAFELLGQVVQQWRQQSRGARPKLRVLSVPCSTGEEPYSIAITLLEAGLNPKQCQIEAVDISRRLLMRAEQGCYGRLSLRGGALERIAPYVEETGGEYQVSPELRRMVQFCQGNLLDPNFVAQRSAYDIIFCRNLLIYFDVTSQQRSLQVLQDLLAPQGVLFLGCADRCEPWPVGLARISHSKAFAYQRSEQSAATGKISANRAATLQSALLDSPTETVVACPTQLPVQPLPKAAAQRLAPQPTQAATQRPAQPSVHLVAPSAQDPASVALPHGARSLLYQAQAAADCAELTKAIELCTQHLIEQPLCAVAHCLLGQIYQAQDEPDLALTSFKRSLYLDPHNYTALLHTALLYEQQGEILKAALLRQRLARNKDTSDVVFS